MLLVAAPPPLGILRTRLPFLSGAPAVTRNDTQRVPVTPGVVGQREQSRRHTRGFYSLFSRSGTISLGATCWAGGGVGCPRGKAACRLPAKPPRYRQRGSWAWPAAQGQDPRLPAEATRGMPALRPPGPEGVRTAPAHTVLGAQGGPRHGCLRARDRGRELLSWGMGSGRHFLLCCSVCGH